VEASRPGPSTTQGAAQAPSPSAESRRPAQVESRPYRYPSWGGLNADEIVELFMKAFDAVELSPATSTIVDTNREET
jgi:hypothetical protein